MDQGRADARTQLTFAAVADELAPDVTELLRVPPYAQGDLSLVSMCNFLPLLWPLLDALDPKRVCEIGADEGTTTRVLAHWARDGSRSLTVVDPTIDPELPDDETVAYVRSTSLDYLAAAPAADLYLIDGDHNYYTVHGELEAIAAMVPAAAGCLLLMHDVSWPCGRRDMYYDPESIPESARRPAADDAVLTMRKSELGEVGMPTDEFRLVEPDPAGKHGVRTAIEDFVSAADGWRFFALPSIYGLGILWHPGEADQAVTDQIDILAADCQRWEQFLATLEFNRLSLLEQRERDGHEWSVAHEAVIELEDEVRRTSGSWEEQQHYIEELEHKIRDVSATWDEQRRYIEELEHKTRDASATWDEQQHIIGELESRLADYDQSSAEQTQQWRQQQEYISDLETRLAGQEQRLAEQEQAAQRLIAELETRVAEQDHAVQRQAHMWADQQRVIDELTAHATKQAATIAELHRPLGWIRFRYRNR